MFVAISRYCLLVFIYYAVRDSREAAAAQRDTMRIATTLTFGGTGVFCVI